VFVLVAVLLGGLAIVLWLDPTVLDGPSPVGLPPLGGRFAGSWIALVAVLAAWAAARNRSAEARMPAVALLALPAGALIAALRTLPDHHPADAAAAYVAALAVLAALGVAALVSLNRRRAHPPDGPIRRS
jgi:hypothetical protein